MDKKEYNEKLEEIKGLIAAEDYSSAAQIADSIDWKRVRNVQTLVMISEVYEAVERYEDSKTLLLRAYRRSPVGRTVLVRMYVRTELFRNSYPFFLRLSTISQSSKIHCNPPKQNEKTQIFRAAGNPKGLRPFWSF